MIKTLIYWLENLSGVWNTDIVNTIVKYLLSSIRFEENLSQDKFEKIFMNHLSKSDPFWVEQELELS